tara:strand:+ start:230 stop:787 length:558 start_codon:yes stop_codon:yes gene_type:complete
MRIIGGKFKGKSIEFLKSKNTRPLKDSVKENIFNILLHSKLININLVNSKVLDLYSGVGSFGLEALSRGAGEVTFIEKDQVAADILYKNIINLRVQKRVRLIKSEVSEVFRKEKFDKYNLFFFDPPFIDKNFIEIINLIKIKKIFNKNNIIIIHRERKNDEEFSKILPITLIKNYGRSKIFFGSF